jgi:hypothetical protein
VVWTQNAEALAAPIRRDSHLYAEPEGFQSIVKGMKFRNRFYNSESACDNKKLKAFGSRPIIGDAINKDY